MSYEDEFQVDNGKSAKFNAGVLQTQRVNKILDLINFCKSNPLAFNMDYSEWNFNLWFRGISTLYDEIDGFMNKEEREACIKIYQKVQDLIEKYPIKEEKRVNNPGNVQSVVNDANWKIIKKAFETFERIVKKYGIEHSVIASTINEDMEGL